MGKKVIKGREIEAKVRALDDAGEWTELDVTPAEYVSLKGSGIKTQRISRTKGADPYRFIDKLFEMKPCEREEVRKKAVAEREYLSDRLGKLQEKKARMMREIDDEIDICADRLKEMRVTIEVLDEVALDETVGSDRKPISELSDDDVPFDEGLAGDNTFYGNIERALAEERALNGHWPPSGEPLY